MCAVFGAPFAFVTNKVCLIIKKVTFFGEIFNKKKKANRLPFEKSYLFPIN